MMRTRVGVLRGGPSNEHEISLKTGASVLEHLDEEKYEAIDVFIDRGGAWHVLGIPVTPRELSKLVDVAFVALHGHYGEDGQVQRELDQFGIPYAGSGVASSALAMNKERAKDIFRTHGLKIPTHVIVSDGPSLDSELLEVFRTRPAPFVIKPLSGGSSIGVSIAESFSELVDGVRQALKHHHRVLIEECISGKEGTCGVLDNFRGEDVYAMPPIEIIPPQKNRFFDYNAKYSGETQEICPGNFTREEKREMERLAKDVHKHLGLRHYSRTDFILSPRGVYVLEVNSLPGLSQESLLPKAVAAVGTTFPDFLDHLVTLARTTK